MDSKKRRENICRTLLESNVCISAGVLASKYGVSRQIVVSDIALLRAEGHKIISTSRGYILKDQPSCGQFISVVCCHTQEQTRDEFYAVVDNGGVVENVIIDHPLYGQISADLNIASRYDANDFIDRAEKLKASQLCELTEGIHIHTIRIPDEMAGRRILSELKQLGILTE